MNRDAPDIRPDNLAFFDIRYPAGYQIALPDIHLFSYRYLIIYLVFLQIRQEKVCTKYNLATTVDHVSFNVCKKLKFLKLVYKFI
jgi:hypothetical protein